jgi:cell division protein FtsI (penicillin-binding protein 3)
MKPDREKWNRIRIKLIGCLFALVFVAVLSRAYYLQIIKMEEWVKMAERQHQKTVQLTPARGNISDRNGLPLAVSIEMDSCFAEPKVIENIPETAARLAPLLGMSRQELEKKIVDNRQKHFVWLQRRITPDLRKRIEALELDGIEFVKETKRFYPNSEIAAHVVGFTGLDPEGLEGIEKRYDKDILGNVGYLITERDALGRDIRLKGTVIKNSSKGNNVTLTIDRNIQYTAEKELAKAVVDNGAKTGMALVMESQTGRILAMANYPTFNPNAYFRFPQFALRNHVVADSFEPGSTFKVLLIASALEEKVISLKDSFDCELGSFGIGGVTIHDTHRYGRLSVADILKFSSNIGASKIGRRMGQERLSAYLKNFGIGERTGIDLPGEATGSVRGGQWYDADLATVSFGQGVSTTAVQLAAAISAVANNGILMKPYMVEKITDENGNVQQQFTPQVRRRVISVDTARKVTTMMEAVTQTGGTGTSAAVEGYSVAGKTGTAQKVDPVTKRYSSKRTGSFIGFVPASNPRLTILVVVDEPKKSPYGGIVAAPAFGAIARQALSYLRIPPEKNDRKAPAPIQQQAMPAPTEDEAAEGEIVNSDDGEQMPNMRGMSIRQVMQLMEKRRLNIRLIGSGRAIEQQPAAGQQITPTDQVWVRFAPSA